VTRPVLVHETKYALVARRTAGLAGRLVDVGARDRVLRQYLAGSQLEYFSTDLGPGHDFTWDLERPLPAADQAFDVVVALDVLEHVEGLHQALQELLRIARRKVFISLPNMTELTFRLHFLRYGQLSAKYALLPDHQGDRHRWLTSYRQIGACVRGIAARAQCSVQEFDLLAGYGPGRRLLARLPLPAALRTYTVLFEITKPASAAAP